MMHFEFLQTANAIAGLGIILFFSYRLKYYLKGILKASSF